MRETMSERESLKATEAICRITNPLSPSPERDQLFVEACREMALFHFQQSPELRHIYRKRGFSPDDLRSIEDIQKIPSVGVTAMKYYLMTSLPEDRAVLKLTSSGTRGQKTQIWFDQQSLDRVQMMLETLWDQEGLISRKLTNYIMFVYDPEEAKDLGIAFSDKNQQRFAPVKETFHTIKKGKTGEWEFRLKESWEKMKSYESQGAPVRVFGIPSFIHEFLSFMMKENLYLKLSPESLVMTGGGWKAAEDKKTTREDFRNMLVERLGIPIERIRDGFGMAEHSAPYIECKHHRFHVPVYNRLIIREPDTMRSLPPGRVGLLELLTPFNAMMPTLSILSTDLAYIDETPCTCGSQTPTFTLVGRAGLVQHKGCAIAASDIVKRGQ